MICSIKVKNWGNFNPRTDVKKSSWFRLENTWVIDPEFFDFTNDEKMVFIMILSQCSIKNSEKCKLSLDYAGRFLKMKPKAVDSALSKLQDLGIILVETLRNADVTPTSRHVRTYERTNVLFKSKASFDSTPFFELWNTHRGSLPEARQMTAKRKKHLKARLSEKSDLQYWKDCITKLAQSKFCTGDNDRGWTANIDFLLRPDSHVKIQEGKYDNKRKKKTREEIEADKYELYQSV